MSGFFVRKKIKAVSQGGVRLNMLQDCLFLPAGSAPAEQKGPLREEPPLFQHCAGGNGPGCLGSHLNAAQRGR